MEVLRAARERVALDQVATDGLGERLEVGNGRHHAEFLRRLRPGSEQGQRHQYRADDEPRTSHDQASVCVLERVSGVRSEEHTSELQSRLHLVCRLLLEKKKTINENAEITNTRRRA